MQLWIFLKYGFNPIALRMDKTLFLTLLHSEWPKFQSFRTAKTFLNPIALRMAKTIFNPIALKMAKTP